MNRRDFLRAAAVVAPMIVVPKFGSIIPAARFATQPTFLTSRKLPPGYVSYVDIELFQKLYNQHWDRMLQMPILTGRLIDFEVVPDVPPFAHGEIIGPGGFRDGLSPEVLAEDRWRFDARFKVHMTEALAQIGVR